LKFTAIRFEKVPNRKTIFLNVSSMNKFINIFFLYSTKYMRVTTPISLSVSLLEHFEEATNSLQADNVTASLVIPAILGIDCMLASCDTQYNTFRLQLRSSL